MHEENQVFQKNDPKNYKLLTQPCRYSSQRMLGFELSCQNQGHKEDASTHSGSKALDFLLTECILEYFLKDLNKG